MLWKKEIHVGFCEKNYHQSEIVIKPYKEYDIFLPLFASLATAIRTGISNSLGITKSFQKKIKNKKSILSTPFHLSHL